MRPVRIGQVLGICAVTVAAIGTACGSPTPDYSSVWSSSPTSATSTTSTSPTPIAQYLEGVGVTGEPVPLDKLTDLKVTLPQPAGWVKYSNANLSPATQVIAKNNTYPTATLIIFKLNGNFDVGEAIKHANVDAEISQNFTKLNSSDADFNGFPSAMIEGSYDLNGKRLHSYNRVVIPVTAAPQFQRYLVQLTVTSLADQAAPDAADIEAIIRGFTVAVK